jgi:hypothetical protein
MVNGVLRIVIVPGNIIGEPSQFRKMVNGVLRIVIVPGNIIVFQELKQFASIFLKSILIFHRVRGRELLLDYHRT